jgi:hypothetical protein
MGLEVGAAITIASFIGAIVGAALSNLVTARQAALVRKEERRKEELNSLRDTMNQMIDTYANLRGQPNAADNYSRHKEVGKFAALCLSSDDTILRELGLIVLNSKSDTLWEACNNAIIRLSEITNVFLAKR